MKRRFLSASMLLLLLASTATAQEPVGRDQGAAHTLLFNVEVLEFSTDLVKEIEKLAQDRARIEKLTAEGKVRSVVDVLIRTRSGEAASARFGQRIPVQDARQNAPQVQYENTGLNLTITPNVLTDNRILIGFSLDLSALARSAGSPHPIFFQRTFSDKVQMKPNERVILLSVVQLEPLWPGATGPQTRDDAYGNFMVVLSARILD